MNSTKRSTRAAHVSLIGVALALALTACTPAGDAEPLPTPTVTVTSMVTATPSPVAADAADPITPLAAWTGCAAIAQHDQFQKPDVHVATFAESKPPQVNPDGSILAFVPVTFTGQGTVVYACQVSGTLGAPKLLSSTMKD